MFGLRKRIEPPDRPFSHADDCRTVRAEPGIELPWSRLEGGRWSRVCTCGEESWYEPVAERTRLDPLDPKTANHLPQCEFLNVTDPGVLRVLLKVTDKGDYAWVECGSCEAGWQVPYFGSESVG
jgi:hypothetical protein